MGEKRILYENLCHRICGMRELKRKTHITCSKNPRVARLQALADLHTFACIEVDPCTVKPQSFYIGGTSSSDDNLIDD